MALQLDLSIGGFAVCPPGSGVATRELGDFEFVWVVAGNATWLRDGREVPAPADTVVLSLPGTADGYRWDARRPTYVAYFHFEVTAGLDTLPPVGDWPPFRRLAADDVVRSLFRQIVLLSEEQPAGWQDVAHGAACHLLTSFVTGTHDTTDGARPPYPAVVERAVLQVKSQWDAAGRPGNVQLDELCRALAVSPRHLSRLFQETFGHGPVATFRLARLHVAATLLANTDLALAQIAAATGFANAFHFSRAFAASHGMSPSAYRAQPSRSLVAPHLAEIRRLVGRLLPRPLAAPR